MVQEIGIKTIVIPFMRDGVMGRIEKRTDIIIEHIDQIRESIHRFQRNNCTNAITLIINEIDFEFISHYFKISGNIINTNSHQMSTFMGYKVLKMKQPGFIISYE